MRRIKTVVVDDELGYSSEIIYLLQFYQQFHIIGEFTDIDEAVKFVEHNHVDCVFSKHNVGDAEYSGDGTYLLTSLMENNIDLLTVLVGEEESFAYRAMTMGITAYMVLPTTPEQLLCIIQRILYQFDLIQFKNEVSNRSLMVKNKEGYQVLQTKDILFVERLNRKIKIVCVGGKEVPITNYSMEDLAEILSRSHFYRCFQSFIVNMEKVSQININSEKKTYTIRLDGYDGEVFLSREKYKEVAELLQKRYSNIQI